VAGVASATVAVGGRGISGDGADPAGFQDERLCSHRCGHGPVDPVLPRVARRCMDAK